MENEDTMIGQNAKRSHQGALTLLPCDPLSLLLDQGLVTVSSIRGINKSLRDSCDLMTTEVVLQEGALQLSDEDQRKLLANLIKRCPHLTSIRVKPYCPLELSQALLPDEIARQCLSLDLTGNRSIESSESSCKNLAHTLSRMTGLQSLNLSNTIMGESQARGIAPAILALTALTRLILQGISYPLVASLAPELHLLSALRSLDLRSVFCYQSSSESGGIGILGPSLQRLSGLQVLRLCGNDLQMPTATMLAPAIQSLTELQVLSLTNIRFCIETADLIIPALQNLTNLTELDLGNARVVGSTSNDELQEFANLLVSCLPLAKRLNTLDLQAIRLDDKGAEALAPNLLQLTSLESLNLRDNQLGAAGFSSLAPCLRALSGLTLLDIGNNCPTSVEVPYIAQDIAFGIQNLAGLKVLYLDNTMMSTEGFKALAPSLNKLTRLETLDLNGNIIGNEGAILLCEVLERMPYLQNLDLRYNAISLDGVKALVRSMQTLKVLHNLHLSFNNLFESIIKSEVNSMLSQR